MMNIVKNLVKNFGNRNGTIPDVIVVHISTNTLASMTSWFNDPISQASSHYGIGRDGTILQYVEEKDKAWTQGNVSNPTSKIVLKRPGINPNLYCLSIENEGQDLSDSTKEQMDSLCELIKDIAKRWNIPIDRDHIIGHFEIDAKNRPYCPSPNHLIMDKIVLRLNEVPLGSVQEDTVKIPRKLLIEISKYL